MKLCFAGTSDRKKMFANGLKDLRFVLESFYYIKPWQAEQINTLEHFMLDSGAFTFLNSKRRNVDVEDYVDRYINFIKQNNVNYFFELDIDSVVGYGEATRIRRKIERKTGKRCIPVWHKSRGIKDFREMCRKYNYVAIGGIVTKEIPSSEHFLLNAFCDYAHSYGCQIHGLGFTPAALDEYRFDSVDSTSWKSGGMYGRLYNFSDGKLKATKTTGRVHYSELDRHNVKQFMRLQEHLYQRDAVEACCCGGACL